MSIQSLDLIRSKRFNDVRKIVVGEEKSITL